MYVSLSKHVWTFSETECTDYTEGTQRISSCTKVQHYGRTPGVGRGAPDVDIFKIQIGVQKANTGSFLESPVGQPLILALHQVAPGIAYN